MVECRTRDLEVPGSNPSVAKKKICHRSNQNNTTYQSLSTRVKYLKLSKVKTRSPCGTVVECRTRDLEVLGSNPSVAKKKICHRSNQNNTTTNPSAPELNTWNYQRRKPEHPLWHSGRVQDKRSRGPGFKPQCGQKEILSQVQSEQHHHQSLWTTVKYLKLSEFETRSCYGAVVECRT